MKTLGIALLATSALCAQNRSGFVNPGYITRTPGSVLFPGGTSALPGVQRTFGYALYPGGGGAQIGAPAIGSVGPAAVRTGPRRNGSSVFVGYPVPVYVGDYSGYLGNYDPSGLSAPAQQQPNITVIYPPAPAPIIVTPGAGAQSQGYALYQPPVQQQAPAAGAQQAMEPIHYLIAFKDHTIYSAVAYWVQGDTLHYFADGNTHNQASLSLVDRDLTRKLTQDTGMEVKLPAAR